MTLEKLYQIIEERKKSTPAGSYVASLFAAGQDRIIQKVGEEAVEVVIASKNSDRSRIVSEAADLLFHMLILLSAKEITIKEILNELERRNND